MSSRPIRIEELGDDAAELSDAARAAEEASADRLALRFRIDADPESLEALRHARRSLLREEWTLGLEPGEPSLEQALFSPTEIVWPIRPGERGRCEEKLRELIARANRARESSPGEEPPGRRRTALSREE